MTDRDKTRQRLRRFRLIRRVGLVTAAFLSLAFILWRANERGARIAFPFDSSREYRVARVVDGDTLLLESGHRVRLLGVDTPETKHPSRPIEPFGPEASQFSKEFANGQAVQLVFDRERTDAYGRVLAWVFVKGQCLNVELVRAGFSEAVLRSPLQPDLRKQLKQAEEEARAAGAGIWSLVDSNP